MNATQLTTPVIPPQALEAEQSVIGGLLLNQTCWDEINDLLSPPDFYDKTHREIFTSIAALIAQGRAVDVITVADYLRTQKKLVDISGEVYLFELVQNTPTVANLVSYAQLVRERSILRQLTEACYRILNQVHQHPKQTLTDLIDLAEQEVFKIAEKENTSLETTDIRILAKEVLAEVHQRSIEGSQVTGLQTGFIDLDALTLGLQPADLIVLAGRPSMGKTALGMNIAEYIAFKEKRPVLIFSLEMPKKSLLQRMLSSLGKIDQTKLRTGQLSSNDWSNLEKLMRDIQKTRLSIDDTAGLTPADMRARVRRFRREHGDLALVVVDYLQLMRLPGQRENRTVEISDISRSLKQLAKEFHVPVIALSQLNRSLEQRTDKRPIMSDLRDSGSIEQDADLILFIYRDEVYHPEILEKNLAELIIAKHRNGPTGKVKLTFRGQYTRFENFSSI